MLVSRVSIVQRLQRVAVLLGEKGMNVGGYEGNQDTTGLGGKGTRRDGIKITPQPWRAKAWPRQKSGPCITCHYAITSGV